MPIGVSKFRLGRWKSAGGGTCTCVGEPGCAQSGTAGAADSPPACARTKYGAAHSNSTSIEGRQMVAMAKQRLCPIAMHSSRPSLAHARRPYTGKHPHHASTHHLRPGHPCPLVQARQLGAQTGGASNTGPYSLTIAVDEVSLTFHAADAHGLPVNDLKLDELTLLDNGKPPHRILAFQSLENFPIRAGILMDTSQSMEASFSRDRAISIRYAQQILRQQTDQAFVMDFGYVSKIVQPWTSDPNALTAGIRDGRVTAAGGSGNAGTTALFTAIYLACLNQFGRIN